jgi:hypothetical protein
MRFISRYRQRIFLLSESIQTGCGANPASFSVATGNSPVIRWATYEAELKNKWHYNSILPYASMACTGTTSTFETLWLLNVPRA